MPLKLETFAGSEVEHLAALIMDLDDWITKRKVSAVDSSVALGVLYGMIAVRAGVCKADALASAQAAVTTGAVMEILGKINDLKK